MTRATVAAAAAVVVALGATGCETTQELSAKIGHKLGHQSAVAGTTGIGAANRQVRVVRAQIVPGNPAAVALELTNTSASPQVDIPVLIDVRDAKGRSVYRNDTTGIDPSLQQLALLDAHATVWWVDNQILASGGAPSSVVARIGAATGKAPAVLPQLRATKVSASNSFPGPHVDATLRNGSAVTQAQLPAYVVALRGGRVVGAGRGIVASLAPGANAPVEVPMTGAVTGATITVSVAPSVGGGS